MNKRFSEMKSTAFKSFWHKTTLELFKYLSFIRLLRRKQNRRGAIYAQASKDSRVPPIKG